MAPPESPTLDRAKTLPPPEKPTKFKGRRGGGSSTPPAGGQPHQRRRRQPAPSVVRAVPVRTAPGGDTADPLALDWR
jgi:hypothetical protein